MPCRFSGPPLAALVDNGIEVAAVVLPVPEGMNRAWSPPNPPHRAPMLELRPVASAPDTAPPSIAEIGRDAGLTILPVASLRDPRTIEALRELRPDAIVVACFPMKLPAAVLELPPLGVLNLHPSLLPRDRGPDPLFWTFHRGDRETGVTVHLMTDRFDAGPILRQERVSIPLGTSRDDLETSLAPVGGALLLDALRARAGGDLTRTPQDERQATYAGHPRPEDHVIDAATWTAERAFRFAKGIPGVSIREPDGTKLGISEVTGWGLSEPGQAVAGTTDDSRLVRLADGWIALRTNHKT